MKYGEILLILSGLGILLSVPLIALFESFEVWVGAKVLYGAGTALFLFNR